MKKVAFDPYQEWLGIAPGSQPPSHYQLLDLDPSEIDPRTIDAAAQQRISQLVERSKDGPPDVAARIKQEVVRARQTLLDPLKRRRYDTSQMKAIKEDDAPVKKETLKEIKTLDTGSYAVGPEGRTRVRRRSSDMIATGKAPRVKKSKSKGTGEKRTKRVSNDWLAYAIMAAVALIGLPVLYHAAFKSDSSRPAQSATRAAADSTGSNLTPVSARSPRQ